MIEKLKLFTEPVTAAIDACKLKEIYGGAFLLRVYLAGILKTRVGLTSSSIVSTNVTNTVTAFPISIN
jgi:hypothetical protein